MSKEIFFNDDARAKIKSGVDKLSNAVKVTLGPKGRNVIIQKKMGYPHITKDGVSVAREIKLKDPLENLGAQIVKEVASRTAKVAGDGTTTATVLAQIMIAEGMKNVTAGANPMDIKKGMEKAAYVVIEDIKSQAIAINPTGSQIARIATISANNDSSIGDLIGEAVMKAGPDCILSVEDSTTGENYITVAEGMSIDSGLMHPFFINIKSKLLAIYYDAQVLICDKKISALSDIKHFVENALQLNVPLVIICDSMEGEALQTLLVNREKKDLKVVVVRAPGFGPNKKEILEDIAIVTGATLISEERGYRLNNSTFNVLGKCHKITASKDETVIVGGYGDYGRVIDRIDEIRSEMSSAKNDFQKGNLEKRLAQMSSGVAVFHVGGSTEVEIKEKKDRVDDAWSATKAALHEGIVPGGGTAYLNALPALHIAMEERNLFENSDELTGAKIILRAIEEPTRTIIANAGIDAGVGLINKIIDLNSRDSRYGYNAKTGVIEDLIASGVIDPAKVSRVALENSVSIASLVLTTECAIIDDNEEDTTAAHEMVANMLRGIQQ